MSASSLEEISAELIPQVRGLLGGSCEIVVIVFSPDTGNFQMTGSGGFELGKRIVEGVCSTFVQGGVHENVTGLTH